MLQMGDSPVRKSEPIAVASPRNIEIADKNAPREQTREELDLGVAASYNNNLISDIKNFDINVYEVISKTIQNYTIEHKIEPGESCTLILRQIRGGLKAKHNSQQVMKIDKTNIRIIHGGR